MKFKFVFAAAAVGALSTSSASADDGSAAFTKAIAAYNSCFLAQFEVYKSLCEPADQVAIAIVHGCPDEYKALQSASIRWLGADKGMELAAKLFPVRKDQAIADIMKERLKHPCSAGKSTG